MIQASRRSRVVTASYLERSNGAFAAVAASAAPAAGDSATTGSLFAFSAPGAPRSLVGTLAPLKTATGAGGSTPSASAMRRVSVLNSISRRKPSSVAGSGSRTPRRLCRDHFRHVLLEANEIARDARLVGELDELFAALGLLDLAGARQERVEVAVLVDQLGRRLDADARHAGDVVGRIAGQRLHVDDLVGRYAELLQHLVAAELLRLHGVEHDDAGPHELHQILVGGDDGDVAAGVDHLLRVGGNEVVGLKAELLDAGDVERLHRVADEWELRDELLRRWRPVGLVVLVDLVAEGLLRGIEDNGEMGRCLGRLGLAQQLPQHGAKAVHGADRKAVGRARQRRQRVEGAEDVAGAIDQVDVAALDNGRRLARRHGRRRSLPGFAFRFAHGWGHVVRL